MKQTILKYIIQDILGEQPDFDLTTDEDLLSSGLVSSIGFFKLTGFLQKEYDINISSEEMVIENFMSVDAICSFISKQKAA